MKSVSRLPTLLKWMFALFTMFTALAALTVVVVMVIDPQLPAGAEFGPMDIHVFGQPGTLVMRSDHGQSVLTMTAFGGNAVMRVEKSGGFIELLKRYGLPLVLLNTLFFAVLFDLLRRLFRNVGRGDSFTQPNLRLVQTIGFSLLVYSVVLMFAEATFSHAILTYLSRNATISIAGTTAQFPQLHGMVVSSGDFPFGSPIFFSGLLVLALSEVFRQGLALKRENELTI